MTQAFEYDVFVSFATGDEALVRPIWEDLTSRDLKVFWSDALRHDRFGASWFNTVQRALEGSRHFLLIWTQAALASSWVEREYVAFIHLRATNPARRLVPFLAGGMHTGDLPLFLRELEACEADDPDAGASLAKLFGERRKSVTRRKPPSPGKGLSAMVEPDSVLSVITGSRPLPRSEVTKRVWDYIQTHGLQDRQNLRMINADQNLLPLFRGKKQVSMFEMTALVSKHLK